MKTSHYSYKVYALGAKDSIMDIGTKGRKVLVYVNASKLKDSDGDILIEGSAKKTTA